MSRVAKKPIALPKGVELNVQAESVSVKGPKGTLSIAKSADIDVKIENGQAQLSTSDAEKVAITGTLRAIIANMVRSEEHTSELQSLMRIPYACFCLKKKK